jgi:hypothetical protein
LYEAVLVLVLDLEGGVLEAEILGDGPEGLFTSRIFSLGVSSPTRQDVPLPSGDRRWV